MKRPKQPPAIGNIEGTDQIFDKLLKHGDPCHEGRYIHWDKARYLTPPDGFTSEQWWAAMKIARLGLCKSLPLKDTDGNAFTVGLPDPAQRYLFHVDRQAAGRIEMADSALLDPEQADRYLVRSLVEEAITSSQLEGAATTRLVAKQMIRTQRRPKDNAERMIFNNYQAMQYIGRQKGKKLSKAMILDLQRILIAGTTDHRGNPLDEHAGRFQRPGEPRIAISDGIEGEVFHTPPPAEELPDRLAAMLDFANGKTPDFFVHPVVRSIVLHFWLAYDHPFYDGNGRTARALFYWSMLSHDYWLAEYISISEIIKRAPVQYGRAFLCTETDNNDLTYFLLYHLEVIQKAIDAVNEYVTRKTREIRAVEAIMRDSMGLNYRQKALLSHALRHPHAEYTVKSHQTSQSVVQQTARSDLYDLAERELLSRQKVKGVFYFTPADELEARIQKMS